MDDLFLTGNEKHIMECKKKLEEEFEMKDFGLKRNLSQPRKVCGRDIEEIQYVGM